MYFVSKYCVLCVKLNIFWEDGLEDGIVLNIFDKFIYIIGKDIFGIRRSKNNRFNYRGNSRKENI